MTSAALPGSNLLLAQTWNMTSALLPARQGKRLFPVLAAASTTLAVKTSRKRAPKPPVAVAALTADSADFFERKIRPVFSDGHDSGIYSWDLLHDFCMNRDRLWEDYLQKLEASGFTRESGRDAAMVVKGGGCSSH